MLEPEDKDGQVQEEGRSATDNFLDKLRGERTRFVRTISSKLDRPMFSVNHNGSQTGKNRKGKIRKNILKIRK